MCLGAREILHGLKNFPCMQPNLVWFLAPPSDSWAQSHQEYSLRIAKCGQPFHLFLNRNVSSSWVYLFIIILNRFSTLDSHQLSSSSLKQNAITLLQHESSISMSKYILHVLQMLPAICATILTWDWFYVKDEGAHLLYLCYLTPKQFWVLEFSPSFSLN